MFSASLLPRSSGVHQMMDDAPLVATAWPAKIQNVTQKRQQLSQLLPWLCPLADVLLLSY